MAVAFRSAGTAASGAAGITPGLPSGHVTDDILLLVVQSSNEAITAPAGYTEVTNSPQGTGTAATAGSTRLGVFWKRDGGSESAPSVADSGNHTIAQILAFSGCITSGNPWDITAGGVITPAATPTNVDMTTTVDNTLVVLVFANAVDSNVLQGNASVSGSNLAGLAVSGDCNTNTNTGGGVTCITGTLATHGAIGAGNFLIMPSSKYGTLSIALKPPAADTTIAGTDYYYSHLAGGQSV